MTQSVDPTLQYPNDCGCCDANSAQTPVPISNRPGLTAIAYRVGTHSQFKQTMLADLSDSERLALQELNTREDDDFSIALLDAWSVVADVLTFYQERIANEAYLRTATQRRSVLEMARTIGYKLSPGVAAGTYLAFTLETAEGSPSSVNIDIGTKAQSVPGQDELPQVFETIEQIEAKAEWNQLKPLSKKKEIPGFGAKEIYLKGVTTELKPGDSLLMIGAEREADAVSERWDFRRIKDVTTDSDADFTEVTWDEELGWQMFSKKVLPAEKDFQVFALRRRAFLFGHNAPDWRTMPKEVRDRYLTSAGETSETYTDDTWPGFNIASISETPAGEEIKTIYLDALYPQIVEGGWIVMMTAEPSFYVEVYEVVTAVESSRENFALTAKTTAVTLDGENLRLKFNNSVRETVVFCENEELDIAEKPVTSPVEGDTVVLEKHLPDLQEKRTIMISGKRIRIRIPDSAGNLVLTSEDGLQTVSLSPDDSLVVMKKPEIQTNGQTTWTLMNKNGFTGTVTTSAEAIDVIDAEEEDAIVTEVNTIDTVDGDSDPTIINLATPLANSFDRSTVVIYANVTKATHGEGKKEVLGSSDGSATFQKFELKQNPLTHVSASTPSGAQTTLEVRVNNLLWTEVPTLYGHGPDERIYITALDNDGKTTVNFGDGRAGARLPTGKENVQASYRKGIGLDGLVETDQISQLMSRPLGLKSVTNPLPATGAEDPESLTDARHNAPLTVLTLDRVVSLQDYEDFAHAYAGIAKALATWTWDGRKRAVFVTVAGPQGAPVDHDSILYENLLTAMRKAGDPHVPLRVESCRQALFQLGGSVKARADYLSEQVSSDVEQKLRDYFSFDARSFGQPIALSEVVAIIQQVKGVEAVFVDQLYRNDAPAGLNSVLEAKMPQAGETAVFAAELLTLDPRPLELEVYHEL